jgi:UDP-2-acetamido-2,6-beta-L-arabino-hexul-4-ose reductase
MNILITGANGFIGKNLLAHIQSKNKFKITTLDKNDGVATFDKKILGADIIFHLAGENRSEFKKDFIENNTNLTKKIIKVLEENKKKIKLIFASSTQVTKKNIYGISKKNTEKELIRYKKKNPNVVIYRLPNIFGKWSKPHYNSVVATFCYQVARKKKINLFNKKSKITLLYIDDLIKQFLRKINKKKEKKTFPILNHTYEISVSNLANLIKSFNKKNKINLINNLKNPFVKKLYSTYISFLPKKYFIYKIKKNIDHRGEFTEFLNNDNFGQFSFFSILPGKIRGNHYHHTKLEKFVVLNGTVRFKFINLSTNLKFSLVVKDNKKKSVVVNTIPGYAHNIKNIGTDIAKLVVWSNEVFDKNNADTFSYEFK